MLPLIYISVSIIAVAFAILVYYLIITIIAMRKTLESVSVTLDGLQKQVDGITKESTELLHKTNYLADDIQKKSDALNSVFLAAKDLGESMNRINQSFIRVSDAVSQKTNEQSEQVAQVVKWGNVALEFWGKWKEKKAKTENKEE
jgi:uncharacterized protein YoxC